MKKVGCRAYLLENLHPEVVNERFKQANRQKKRARAIQLPIRVESTQAIQITGIEFKILS